MTGDGSENSHRRESPDRPDQNPLRLLEDLSVLLVGPVLAVRPYCHTSNYWQVYFDSYKMIRQTLADAHFPAPMPAQTVVVQQS